MSSSDAWGSDDIPDQIGRRFVITGGNSGIGLEAARHLLRAGGDVVITSRSVSKGEAAAESLRPAALVGSIEVAALDLADLASVRAFAEMLVADARPIDVLINNAGVMGTPYSQTTDGFELQLGTNHLGHFALTGLVLPALLRADTPRVVTVSSLAHTQGRINFDDLMSERRYSRVRAYMQSKLANLLFVMELQRRFRRGHVDALSLGCHPGMSSTNLTAGMTGGAWEKVMAVSKRFEGSFSQSGADGALPTVRAALDTDVKGGDVFGPGGFGEIRGDAVKVKPRPRAFDVHDARALWERSVDLTGVDYAAIDPPG